MLNVIDNETALVVFSDETDLWWLKKLRRGFRHCFVVLRKNGMWVAFDPLANRSEISLIDVPDGFNLNEWLEDSGCTVIITKLFNQNINRPLLPAISSCVESVKRVLGIRKWFILTPWQLYCYLKSYERK